MQRRLAICLTVGVLGVACAYAQTPRQTDPKSKIVALQHQRIELLEKRVSQLKSIADHDLIDRRDLIQPQMDLINARLEYARSSDEKNELLTSLLGKYDELIAIAKAASHAPAQPSQPGRHPRHQGLAAASEMLRLQSERVRIEIALEMLN